METSIVDRFVFKFKVKRLNLCIYRVYIKFLQINDNKSVK